MAEIINLLNPLPYCIKENSNGKACKLLQLETRKIEGSCE